jgi:hypothetical protein
MISPDKEKVVYTKNGLFVIPVHGTVSDTVKLADVGFNSFIGHGISPDNTRLLRGGGGPILLSMPLTGPMTATVNIAGPMVLGGNVEYYYGWSFSPDGRRVVYRADQEIDGQIQLYVTDEGYLLGNRVFLPLIRR